MQDWILVALLAHTFFAGSAVAEKVSQARYFRDTESMAVLIALAQSLPVLLLPFLDFGKMSATDIAVPVFAGFLAVLPYWLYAEALKTGEVSRIAPLWQTIPLFVVVLAFLFLGERLPALFYLAFTLMLIGSLLFSVKEFASALKPKKPFWLMLLASFIFAVQTIVLKSAYNGAGFLEVLALLCAGRVATSAVILALPRVRERFSSNLQKADKRPVFAIFTLSTLAIVFYNYAIYLGSVSIVEVLSGIYPFLVLLFATFAARWAGGALSEKFERKGMALKAIAGTLMFIGLALLYI